MSNTDTAHARSIPWDCSDWQAAAAVDDADDARVSVILESLAANRGKTLYCAVDQSDTFTKAETWAAGRDRNERDDTVYYGENGRFRGFLAAQEGYLTDGESGVTGISRDRIFEFPEEQRRRKKTIKRRVLPPNATDLVWSEWGGSTDPEAGQNNAITVARHRFTGTTNPHWIDSIPNARYGPNSKVDWPTLMREQGVARCRAIGYQRVSAVELSRTDPADPAISWDAAKTNTALAWPAASRSVADEGTSNADALSQADRFGGRHFALVDLSAGNFRAWARQAFPYTVTCEKTVIRRRRN